MSSSWLEGTYVRLSQIPTLVANTFLTLSFIYLSELSASGADADAARRGREGAVERATHATVLSTRAENAEQFEIMERLLADTRVEMKTSVIESAAEARRVASDEHARLREKNRE